VAGDLDDLIRLAEKIRSRAHAPYSGFSVGAAVLAEGRIYTGVNVENASYPVGLCAERVAAAAAVTAGERSIDAIAIAGGSDRPAPPCGACRQFLSEFGPDMRVIAVASRGSREEWTLSELLPDAFGPDFLP
jgi:cytidine deaminase